jgi:hypothetical protein
MPYEFRYYNRKGNEVAFERYINYRAIPGYYLVKRTHLSKGNRGVTVSTVWIGYDIGFDHDTPQIFETMHFLSHGDDKGWWKDVTEADAIKRHDVDVKAYENDGWEVYIIPEKKE